MSHIIAPSILTSDFLNLEREIRMLNGSDADWIHLDVMDGSFVPNLTFGFRVISLISKIAEKPLDAHLMIIEPEKHLESFRDAGVNKMTVHYEACPDPLATIRNIRSLGMDPGMAISPDTPVSAIKNLLPELDLVLNMTVNPGYGAQKFLEGSWDKIRELRNLINNSGLKTLVQVDGGVGFNNIRELLDAGVNCFAVGNTVFGADDPVAAIARLKRI